MPKIQIALDAPSNNQFYSTNDTISGSINVNFKKSASVKQIRVVLKGYIQTITQIDTKHPCMQNRIMIPNPDGRAVHSVMELQERVFPEDSVWNGMKGSSKSFKVTSGDHQFKFKFPKLSKRPACLKTHTTASDSFIRMKDARLPPSFNAQWQDITKIKDLAIFFYSFGKVLYFVQVQIEMGSKVPFLTPYGKYLTETLYIEFIPTPEDTAYPIEDEKPLINKSKQIPDKKSFKPDGKYNLKEKKDELPSYDSKEGHLGANEKKKKSEKSEKGEKFAGDVKSPKNEKSSGKPSSHEKLKSSSFGRSEKETLPEYVNDSKQVYNDQKTKKSETSARKEKEALYGNVTTLRNSSSDEKSTIRSRFKSKEKEAYSKKGEKLKRLASVSIATPSELPIYAGINEIPPPEYDENTRPDFIDDNDDETTLVNVNDPTSVLRIYKSRLRIQLPNERSQMWTEVRSKGLRQTYRGDHLFRDGCQKFDSVFVMMDGDLTDMDKLSITPVNAQLNLIEHTTYVAQGVANENFSVLRLIDIKDLMVAAEGPLLDLSEATRYTDEDGRQVAECELKLKDHPILKKIRFNNDDYIHRGNRLYSFKSCTIKREFYLQLTIGWRINGRMKQITNYINRSQIFCQQRKKITVPRINRERVSQATGIRTPQGTSDRLPEYGEVPT